MTSEFVPTTTNMAVIVRNIIQGYRDGALRALAQEPVQNSMDAAQGCRARVEYRLHKRRSRRGEDFFLLTVTDSNTSGLRGSVRSLAEAVAEGALGEGENWAAFEGMGYTKKSSEEALGSRGQGKAACLYYSNPPAPMGQERMLMLYDTLLPNGEYRLGVRYANPSDVKRNPPLLGDEARSVIRSRYDEHGIEVELGLEPLREVGARIIVPYLSEEAVEAIRSGELFQWLQRCWWRAVQVGLSISVVQEDGPAQDVSVPRWWEGEPWRRSAGNLRSWENVEVGNGLKIKRVVLLYDESLSDDESLSGTGQPDWGVQLLRGRQWIETLGQETLGDYVPRDRRAGFRGFVEFDGGETERALRRAESSQHDRFDRRYGEVKALVAAVVSKVREFAEARGWGTPPPPPVVTPDRERDAALEFLRFLSPHTRRNGSGPEGTGPQGIDRWECSLRLDYPTPRTTRVNWGERIRNVEVAIKLEPSSAARDAIVSLDVLFAGDSSSPTTCVSKVVEVRGGQESVNFGDFQIIEGVPRRDDQLHCRPSGQWRLIARVEAAGRKVASSSRSIFVNEDPPPPPPGNPYALSISVENHTTGARRINSGDVVGVQINVSNRTPDATTFELTASLGDLLLADAKPVPTPGTPAGASPDRVAGLQTSFIVSTKGTGQSTQLSASLPPGRHSLRADLLLGGEVVAHASRTLDIEIDPAQPQDGLPFRIAQVDGTPFPRWQFDKSDPLDWALQYPSKHPLYRELERGAHRAGQRLSGTLAFVVEVCAEGIIEWAMDPISHGDASRLDDLLSGVPSGASPERWLEYSEKMQRLAGFHSSAERLPGSIEEYSRLFRDCAARALSLFEERG